MGDTVFTVIISSFATLLAVGISHLISEYRKFNGSLNGLINEIEKNVSDASILADILQIEYEGKDSEEYRTDKGFTDAKLAITLKRFDYRSYDFFRSNGFFRKIDPEIQKKIDDLYWDFEAINRCIELYHFLKENKTKRWDSESIKNGDIIQLYLDEIEKICTKDFRDRLKKIHFKI